jgi:ATP-binding cassette subfamily G (WHITE) protein 2 (PDR)
MSVGIGDFQFTNQEKHQPSLARASSHQPLPYPHPTESTDAQPPHVQTDNDRNQEINHLARQITQQSSASRTVIGDHDLFNYNPDSDLDPFSDKFDAKKWTKGMSHLSRESGILGRVSGVSFRGLSVHGYGSDAGDFIPTSLRARNWGES